MEITLPLLFRMLPAIGSVLSVIKSGFDIHKYFKSSLYVEKNPIEKLNRYVDDGFMKDINQALHTLEICRPVAESIAQNASVKHKEFSFSSLIVALLFFLCYPNIDEWLPNPSFNIGYLLSVLFTLGTTLLPLLKMKTFKSPRFSTEDVMSRIKEATQYLNVQPYSAISERFMASYNHLQALLMNTLAQSLWIHLEKEREKVVSHYPKQARKMIADSIGILVDQKMLTPKPTSTNEIPSWERNQKRQIRRQLESLGFEKEFGYLLHTQFTSYDFAGMKDNFKSDEIINILIKYRKGNEVI